MSFTADRQKGGFNFPWIRKKEPLDNALFDRPDYVFAFEDKASRDEAKRALSFTAPNTFLDVSEERDNVRWGRFYSVDYTTSAFEFERPESDRQIDVESCPQYGTIFTYSNLPNPDLSLVDQDVRIRHGGGGEHVHGSFTYLLHALSIIFLLLCFPILCWLYIKRLSNNERLIIYRLGRRLKPKGPGFVILLPFCDQFYTIRLDEQTVNITPVSGGTEDEAIVEVHCAVTYRLFDIEYAYQATKESPSKLVNTQTQLCLLPSLSRLTWSQLDQGGAKEDLAIQTMGSLNSRCASQGIQISRVKILDLRLLRSPPSPNTVRKNRMSTVQKQLHALTSAFFQKSAANRPTTSIGRTDSVDSSAPTCSTTDLSSPDDARTCSSDVAQPLGTTKQMFSNEDPGSSCESSLHTVCDQVLARAQPFLNNSLVCSALGHTVLQLVVCSAKPQRPLPTVEMGKCPSGTVVVRLDAKCGRSSKGPFFSGGLPDVTIYVSASDLADVMAGKLDFPKAIHDEIIFVDGSGVILDKLKHLL